MIAVLHIVSAMSSSGIFPAVSALWQSKKEKYRKLQTPTSRNEASNTTIGRGARRPANSTQRRERSPSITRAEREAEACSVPRSGNKARQHEHQQKVSDERTGNSTHADRECSDVGSNVKTISNNSVVGQGEIFSDVVFECNVNAKVDRHVSSSDKRQETTDMCNTPSKRSTACDDNARTDKTEVDNVTHISSRQSGDNQHANAVKSWIQINTRANKHSTVSTTPRSELPSTGRRITGRGTQQAIQKANTNQSTPAADNSRAQAHTTDATHTTKQQKSTDTDRSKVKLKKSAIVSTPVEDQTNNAYDEVQNPACEHHLDQHTGGGKLVGSECHTPVTRRACTKVSKRIEAKVGDNEYTRKKIRTDPEYTPPAAHTVNRTATGFVYVTPITQGCDQGHGNLQTGQIDVTANHQPVHDQVNSPAATPMRVISKVSTPPGNHPNPSEECIQPQDHTDNSVKTSCPNRQGRRPIIASHYQHDEKYSPRPYQKPKVKQASSQNHYRLVEQTNMSYPVMQDEQPNGVNSNRHLGQGTSLYSVGEDGRSLNTRAQHLVSNLYYYSSRPSAVVNRSLNRDNYGVVNTSDDGRRMSRGEVICENKQSPGERVILRARRKCTQPPVDHTNEEANSDATDEDEFSPLVSPHTIPPNLTDFIPGSKEVLAKFSIPTEHGLQIPCAWYMSDDANKEDSAIVSDTQPGGTPQYIAITSTQTIVTMANGATTSTVTNSRLPVSAGYKDKAAAMNANKAKCTPEKSVCKVKPFMKNPCFVDGKDTRTIPSKLTNGLVPGTVNNQQPCSQPLLIKNGDTAQPGGNVHELQHAVVTPSAVTSTPTGIAPNAMENALVIPVNAGGCVLTVQAGKRCGLQIVKPGTSTNSNVTKTRKGCPPMPMERFIDKDSGDPLYWEQDIMKLRFAELVHIVQHDDQARNKNEIPAINMLAEDCRMDTQQMKDEMNLLEKEFHFYGHEIRKSWDKLHRERTNSEQAKNESPRKQRRTFRNRRGGAHANDNGGAGFLESQQDVVLRRSHRLGRAIRKMVREGELTEERIEEYTKACRALRDQADRQKVLTVEYMKCRPIAGQLPAVVAKYRGRTMPHQNGLYLDYQGVPEQSV